MTVRPGRQPATRACHLALLYHNPGEYADAVSGFLRSGVNAGERALAAVPGDRHGGLRAALGSHGDDVVFADMTSLGTNPARIIPAIHAFADEGTQPVRVVTEPVWPGRSAAEIAEAAKHEALVNLAFTGPGVRILCPYDASCLPQPVLADARRTHPRTVSRTGLAPGPRYRGPGKLPAACTARLPAPPARIPVLGFDDDLRRVRDFVAGHARAAGLPAARAAELVLAASEVAANTLRHSGGGGTVRCWQVPGELICELRDSGCITDPLAGRRLPRPEQAGGHGLWLVNRCVDLAEVRTGRHGTATRLHVRLPRRLTSGNRSGGLVGSCVA
jgi:anti-sigma regulatory factor (Ser/Thr protein kinase)